MSSPRLVDTNRTEPLELVAMRVADETIHLVAAQERYWVPMRALTERFGIGYYGQRVRLLRDGWRYGTRLFVVRLASGAAVEQACIPAQRLPVWVWLLAARSRVRIGAHWTQLLTAQWEEALLAFYIERGVVLPRYALPGELLERAATAAGEALLWRARAESQGDRAAHDEATRLRAKCERMCEELGRALRKNERLRSDIEQALSGSISPAVATSLSERRWGPRKPPHADAVHYQDTHWYAAVAAALEKLGTKGAVAEALGCSRTAVSLLLAGRYPARTDSIERKVRAKLMFKQEPVASECPPDPAM